MTRLVCLRTSKVYLSVAQTTYNPIGAVVSDFLWWELQVKVTDRLWDEIYQEAHR
jgi:hypothetical protein